MKICKITINSFGKLKEKTYTLNGTFNSFILNNGEGKSTLFNFILAMFYGVGKNSLKELRGLYMPWNEKSASGSIEFIYDKINYRLDRTFAKTQKNDEAHLYNIDTGKEISIPNNEFGKYFFNLDIYTFKSTLFITDKDIIVNASTNLNNMLVNTINTGDAAISFEQANNRLSEYAKVVDASNRHSKAFQLLKEKDDLTKAYDSLGCENQKAINLLSDNKLLEKRKEEIEDKQKFYKKVKQYNNDKKLYNDYLHYMNLKSKIENNNNEKDDEENYDALIENVRLVNSKPEKKTPYITLVLPGILLIISFLIENLPIKIILIILGFLSALLFVLLFNNVKKFNEKLRKEKEEYNTSFGGVKTEDAAILYINNLKEKSLSKKNSNSELDKLYMDFLEKHNVNELLKYSAFVINNEYENIKDEDKQLQLLSNELYEIDNKMSKNEGILSTIDNSSKLAELKSRIDEHNNTLSSFKKQKEAYLIAKQLIDESKEEVFNNFTPGLKKHLSEVLNELSGGKFKDILIDSELNIKLDEGSNLFALDYYSQGYKDLVYLSLRIAIIKMAIEKSLPIFLDDPFAHLDPNNKKRAMDYLKKLSSNNQIFYFSCTNID